jgi:hypothetical protein
MCLLLAFVVSLAADRWRLASVARGGLIAATLACWVFVSGSDFPLRDAADARHFATLPSVRVARQLDPALDAIAIEIQRRTRPEDTLLCLSFIPMLYVLADRDGPGQHDVLLPGAFLDAAEERAFVERLERDPPAVVADTRLAFDGLKERTLEAYAPQLDRWVKANYSPVEERFPYFLAVRNDRLRAVPPR